MRLGPSRVRQVWVDEGFVPSLGRDRPAAAWGPVLADDSKLSNVGGNGFIWILLVAAGTFFVTHQVTLEGNRPATTERSIHERIGEQHVDARLWQDPSRLSPMN
jgi:hypothetical protein